VNGLALCSGIGGIDLGLRLALGQSYRTVCHVEREAYAAACLVARMEDQALDATPIWDDLLTFDGRPWRGVVDIVTAGFPCQPWSQSGRRLGLEDERWIWPDISRVIGEISPGVVLLENVPGLVRFGLREVLSDLASLGFNAEWDHFSACEMGATHTRERVFILAHSNGKHGSAWLRHTLEQQDGALQPGYGAEGAGACSDPWLEDPSGLWGGADGVPDRMERNRAVGNGACPIHVAFAFLTLARRAGRLVGRRDVNSGPHFSLALNL